VACSARPAPLHAQTLDQQIQALALARPWPVSAARRAPSPIAVPEAKGFRSGQAKESEAKRRDDECCSFIRVGRSLGEARSCLQTTPFEAIAIGRRRHEGLLAHRADGLGSTFSSRISAFLGGLASVCVLGGDFALPCEFRAVILAAAFNDLGTGRSVVWQEDLVG
jgi:hypothetical protein